MRFLIFMLYEAIGLYPGKLTMLVVMEDVQFLQLEPKLFGGDFKAGLLDLHDMDGTNVLTKVRYCMHCQAHVKGFDHRGSRKLYR
ncbi:hypothetical protein HanRHA438_Chr03g0140691 [Helianthus annuus]|nr:hypothetical protein HanHA300_Chr03g0107631 [Helianthus annuus]KAJ0609379.1 hypothetical protein HanHA89_Chr03g0119361 [Helianthus annuus]KAJ0769441.1 hypothetical protein HanLR1_Chr03g0112771 [Helianthus annuus]KAJ0775166.1 hypothetical protein HanOQP8_Chr03g0119911 [Helianthus annuus]KAJ0937303.1 hypothetical protein HanRHA438_Chr03g0140691 [Helianthus annuus]